MPPLPRQFAFTLLLSDNPSAQTHEAEISPSSLLTFLSKQGLKKGELLGANWGRKECKYSFANASRVHVHNNLLLTYFR